MEQYLSEMEQNWLEGILQKFDTKVEQECIRIGDKIPYLSEEGCYRQDLGETDIAWWTNGFWGGILWQLYHVTGKENYKEKAMHVEVRLDQALSEYEGLYHDVGFMWMHTAVADYRLTGSHASYVRGQHAANLLAGRFNVLGNFIRAWNDDKAGWIIIDCLMNLSLLYWASEESGDPRFAAIAKRHADTALEELLRPDGSAHHIAVLDATTGEALETPAGQGYAEGSSWSRGQSWAVYGFAISYAHTGEVRYLDAAKKAAHYFISNVALSDYLPLCDFRAPKDPVYYDATAGACAACGMLEIAKHVTEYEKPLYIQSAFRMIKAMEGKFCNWDNRVDGVLGMGRVDYHDVGKKGQVPIIYGDYFFIEAVLRLLNKDFFIW